MSRRTRVRDAAALTVVAVVAHRLLAPRASPVERVKAAMFDGFVAPEIRRRGRLLVENGDAVRAWREAHPEHRGAVPARVLPHPEP